MAKRWRSPLSEQLTADRIEGRLLIASGRKPGFVIRRLVDSEVPGEAPQLLTVVQQPTDPAYNDHRVVATVQGTEETKAGRLRRSGPIASVSPEQTRAFLPAPTDTAAALAMYHTVLLQQEPQLPGA